MNKFLLALAMTGVTAMAQSVISAKAGVVHYTEGDVTVNDEALVMKPNKFPDMKNNDVLRTTEGRAEILLAPGAFLRLGENSAAKMISNSLLSTKLALLDGSAVIEVLELDKLGSLEFVVAGDTLSIRKAGLYRIEVDPPSLKVYDGEVAVNFRDELVKLGSGRMMTLSGDHLIAKFEKKSSMDELVQWTDRRASTLAMANLHSAKSVANGYGSSSLLNQSGWVFNPYYSMYTYVPFNRAYYSYFGYGFYSPGVVYGIYHRPPTPTFNDGGFGNNGGFGNGNSGYNAGGGYYGGSASRGMGSMSGGGGLGASGGSAPVSGGERAAGSAGAGGARGGGAAGGRAQ